MDKASKIKWAVAAVLLIAAVVLIVWNLMSMGGRPTVGLGSERATPPVATARLG